MDILNYPRSTLHTIEPMGQGTAAVESLTSYFCRLAHSHGMTSRNLAAWVLGHFDQAVPDDYKWFRRAFSGMSLESEQWAAWLAELTGVSALDRLTLVPWRSVLSNPGLAAMSNRWCPCCLSEDKAAGNTPYLRLAWDVAPVTACLRHKVALVSGCPHCEKSNVRNRASTVIPGYCTACGGFLGDALTETTTPGALWVARQVGQMLSHAPMVSTDGVGALLEMVIERMADGRVATFAQKLGLSRSGVWHWVNKGGLPTLEAWLAICLHGGISLDTLFAGELDNWVLPVAPVQMPIPLQGSPRKGIKSRVLNWDAIRAQLCAILDEPMPISLGEACLRVGIDCKVLYQQANVEARAIADRLRRYQSLARQEREGRLREKIGELIQERRDAGYEGMSAREVWHQLEGGIKSVRHTYRFIGTAVAAND